MGKKKIIALVVGLQIITLLLSAGKLPVLPGRHVKIGLERVAEICGIVITGGRCNFRSSQIGGFQ